MRREDLLETLVNKPERWGKAYLLRFGHLSTVNTSTQSTIHDPITIDDWNRSKIKPSTKIRILSEEHNKYVLYLAKCLGFDCGYGEPNFGFMCFLNDMTISYYNDEKYFIEDDGQEIFIEMPKAGVSEDELTQEIIDNAPEGAQRYSEELLTYFKLEGDDYFYSWGKGRKWEKIYGVGLEGIEKDFADAIPLKTQEQTSTTGAVDRMVTLNIPAEEETNINAKVLAEKVGSKYDQGKPRYDLIPVHAEAEFVDVLTFGATKYGAENWRKVEDARARYQAALGRHIAAYRMGETHDIESGKHHLAHAMCCLSFIIELDLEDNQ